MKTNPNVILEGEPSRVAIGQRSVYRYTGRLGSYETVYAMVTKVASHPFKQGDKVRIGGGKVVYTIEFADRNVLSLKSRNSYKTVSFASIARIFPVEA